LAGPAPAVRRYAVLPPARNPARCSPQAVALSAAGGGDGCDSPDFPAPRARQGGRPEMLQRGAGHVFASGSCRGPSIVAGRRFEGRLGALPVRGSWPG
ncbi:unnamed protein product, partial [Ectocarpus sp. 12 AP-2014]